MTDILRAWVGRSFRNRIFVAMLAATLLPLLVCGGLMLNLQVVRSQESLAQESHAQLAALGAALDDFRETCRDIAGSLADSTVVHSALRRGGGDSRTLYQVLYRTTEPLRPYARFDIYDGQGVCCYTTASAPPSGELDPGWGVLWDAGQEDGLALRAGEDGGLIAAQAVRSRSGAILGYVTAQVEQAGFDRMFNGLYSAAGEALLLDGRWRTVYCSQPSQGRATVERLREQLLSGKPLTGVTGEYAFFAAQRPDTGYVLILQRPRPFTALVLRSFYLVGAIVGAVCLLLCMWCAWVLSRALSRPVHQLDEAMGEVERGRLDVRLETDRDDELGRLSSRFNRMAAEYRLNLERSVQRERELNRVRLGMLQAQLNPHFLCNTLDTMKWISKINKVPQVAVMSTNLADILRFCISPEEFVPLRREAEILDRYIEIQRIRMSGAFTYAMDLPPELEDCLIPKMILQPLVENAILHGLEGRDDGAVRVAAREEGGLLRITVSDNGPGFPPELAAGRYRRESRHLGLYNVDTILTKYYGGDCGLFLSNEGGAVVTAVLPVVREEEEMC